ncbi:acyl carrier protein [Candidatus Nitrotoga sp. M5]|uniref:acyl carrier protein n=1 Tax=Candidatus Nitrotoga sp. M5 TaxID=2890409 RepID=UPI001EF416B6|nr:acyl carrier protein [Candidatus Nitrotoga sp. M5]CAH1388217.1 Acyl carrier protein [Candidatus Nitrotoga sp. M5]
MEYQRILTNLYDGLTSFTKGSVEITEDTELVGDLNLDSLQIMELLLSIEDRFDISIPVSILPDVKTVSDLAIQIEKITRSEQG